MGLFDKLKEKRYEKLDREYVEGWNAFQYKPNLVGFNMNTKIFFTEEDRKDAEECFALYLKLKDTSSSTAKEYNLFYAASKGHEEANRLVRSEYFLAKYQADYRSYHVSYWNHLYICKEGFGFKWAQKEFSQELEKDVLRIEELNKNPRKFPRLECKVPDARQKELVNIVTNTKLSNSVRANAIIEGLKGGYYFTGREEACKTLASTYNCGFNAIYFFLNDPKGLTAYIYNRIGSHLNKDQVELVESILRSIYARSRKISDAAILGNALLYLDPTPANVVEALSLLRYAAKKGDKTAVETLANNSNIVSRREALEVLKEVARSHGYSSKEDLIHIYSVVKEGRLYKEGAEFVYEFFTIGGHDKNIKGFIKDDYNLVKFLKEIDMNGLGYLQFNYEYEQRFTPKSTSKTPIEADEFYDLFFEEFKKFDPVANGYSMKAATDFYQIMKTLTKDGMTVDQSGGKTYIEFAFRHVTTNADLCAFAVSSGAYPDLLSKAYQNELNTINIMKDRYQRIIGTKEDPGSYEAYLREKGLEWINDPIEGFKPKCAQQLIVDIMDMVKGKLREKYNVVYRDNPCVFHCAITTSQR